MPDDNSSLIPKRAEGTDGLGAQKVYYTRETELAIFEAEFPLPVLSELQLRLLELQQYARSPKSYAGQVKGLPRKALAGDQAILWIAAAAGISFAEVKDELAKAEAALRVLTEHGLE